MSKRKSEAWKGLLKPFADIIENIELSIERLPDEDLLKLSKAIDEPTQTNCGWSTYRAAQYLEPLVTNKMLRRQLNDWIENAKERKDNAKN